MNEQQEQANQLLLKQLIALSENVNNSTAVLANASALLNEFLKDINWVGFYLLEDEELILGPFQGKPACIHIPIGKGVCGIAAQENQTMLVHNVNEFIGHIACDSASRSEIVIPIHKDNKLFGVLDIDSPNIGRFTELDQMMLENFARTLENYL